MSTNFSTLDYGTKITTSKMIEVQVGLNPDIMVKDFASAYVKELTRLNPIKAREITITDDQMYYYFKAILAFRVKSITGENKDWRFGKQIAIPSWIQHTISQIGVVYDRVRGLKFVPTYAFDYDVASVIEISNDLLAFEADGLLLHTDAFPREKEGDPDVMGMAILDDYVHSISDKAHPIASYVAGFVGAKLAQEQAFSILYRVRYDDIDFITSQLVNDRKLKV